MKTDFPFVLHFLFSQKRMMTMKRILFFLALTPLLLACPPAEARRPEPAAVPPALKGTAPHNPRVAPYYLDELVREGKITRSEAHVTQAYMMFRHARRQQDLKQAAGMTKEDRRAYMKRMRKLRGNPLVEYASFCGLTLERARDLSDIMHDSRKGSRYYEKAKQSASRRSPHGQT